MITLKNKSSIFKNKVILVTGGTSSFGKKFIYTVLKNFDPKKIIIYSRDELKQFHLSQILSKYKKKINYTLKNSEIFYKQAVSLPIFYSLKNYQIKYIIKSILDLLIPKKIKIKN
jgi:FlaA1/EpsC-like NDP-sugar epimerase